MKKDFLRKYLPEIICTVAGAIGGFLYWKYVGCVRNMYHQVELVPDDTVGCGAWLSGRLCVR